MVGAVVQISRQLDHGITRNALDHRVLQSLFYCGIEVLGNGTAHNGYGKGQTLVLTGSEADLYVTVLTRSTVLLLMLALYVYALGDLLAVGDLGSQ